MARYMIVFKCAGCGYTLYILNAGGWLGGRGLGHVSLKWVTRRYKGVCPNCGRRLGRPSKLEFKTLEELS